MALIKSGPTAPKAQDPIQVKIHSPTQTTATVDTNYTPRSSLLQYVDGSSWEVEYYSQVLGVDSEPTPWDINSAATIQQYIKISQMELKVTTPLQASEEEPSRDFTVTGTATVYPHVKPNVGDCFIADIGDGRAALFSLTKVTRKTYLRDSFTEVEYSLVDYIDSKPQIPADLARKTIKRTVFVREFLQWGQNPQILEGELEDLVALQNVQQDLINFYFKDFFSLQNQSFLIPGQKAAAYDPFLTKALLEWVSSEEMPMIGKVKSPIVLANRNSGSYTLWSALSHMNASYLAMSVQFMRLMDASMFKGLPEIGSVYYTGIRLIACPLDNRTDVDADYGSVDPCACACQESFVGGVTYGVTGLRWKDLLRYEASSNPLPIDPNTLPDIVPVTTDEYYVLSEKFYRPTGGPMASKLEVLVKQALNNEALDRVTLLALARNAHRWPNLERYYYIPLLFALIKVALRTQ